MTGYFSNFMKLKDQILTLRTFVRFLLPEYEAHGGGLLPEEREMVKKHAADIRKFLRDTAPKKKKKEPPKCKHCGKVESEHYFITRWCSGDKYDGNVDTFEP